MLCPFFPTPSLPSPGEKICPTVPSNFLLSFSIYVPETGKRLQVPSLLLTYRSDLTVEFLNTVYLVSTFSFSLVPVKVLETELVDLLPQPVQDTTPSLTEGNGIKEVDVLSLLSWTGAVSHLFYTLNLLCRVTNCVPNMSPLPPITLQSRKT